jgi:hypothetical protein
MTDPRAEYTARLQSWTDVRARLERLHAALASVRLALAGIAAILAWQAFVSHRLSAMWLFVPAAAFAIAVLVHARIIERSERADRARQLYQRGLARLDGTWAGSGPDGARFSEGHSYAHDLDLFGPASLFQLLDTARTQVGEDTLASWLGSGSPVSEVRARQDAVTELGGNIRFREDLAVLAAESYVGRTDALRAWAMAPPARLSAVHALIFAACGATSAVLVVLVAVEAVPMTALIAWIVLQSLIIGLWRRRILAALAGIDTAAHDLALVAALLARIEREPFASGRLRTVRDALFADGIAPSRRIARLEGLVSMLDSVSLNLLVRPIGALVVARSQLAVAIDRWHAAHGPQVDGWLRAIGDVEALAALGTYKFEHPADPFPVLADSDALFDSARLAHPLIIEDRAVRNDIRLGGSSPSALIVSGSNMSGKSTLLRAVGLNVVLALAGAPVRAERLTMGWLVIGATLRVDDSLREGHSRFYTEILRIRAIVDLATGGRPLLFLLDEIFGGTNSHDRRVGAEAIVRMLVGAGAIGLITTHDLALTEIATTSDDRVANVHFEDRIEGGRMLFDYRMQPGIVERSNALALMRAVGLKV